eukprot:TRINITY_DN2164_c0_g1_i2.p1 TRINITY_DN2164_c0_g1~~TRINITY_DN2164_c0_g1_i2.p1  ORF type:complete len:203 (+),score=14.18 TRINITY_DN2164_c0_g1_i2:567-1175(+)
MLMKRFKSGDFDAVFSATIAIDFNVVHAKTIASYKPQMQVKLQLWDSSGHEKYRAIRQAYYRGSHGFLIVFSLTNRESFEHVRNWIEEIKRFGTPGAHKIFILVGTKADVAEERKVSLEEARKLAAEVEAPYFETSPKTGEGVDIAYFAIASMALRNHLRLQDLAIHPQSGIPVPVTMAPPDQEKGWFATIVNKIFGTDKNR